MQNTFYTGDNLYILNGMNSDSVDLIYLDPPFNSKRTYSAPIGSKAAGASFKDMWTWGDVDEECLNGMADYPELAEYIYSIGAINGKAMMSYITYMTQRLIQMHRVLRTTGSLYLHCDTVASHYLKIILDGIFGEDNFRNEIVWHYGKWSNVSKHFQKNHDVILFYSKSDTYTFNPLHVERRNPKPYNIQGGEVNQLLIYRPEDTPDAIIEREKAKGRKVIYIDTKGPSEHDVWSYLRNKEIDFIPPRSKERTGYPTQKPLTLLHRIINVSSRQGDVVFDPFCGCATTCVAAQQLQRGWIGIDIESQAADLLMTRLGDDSGMFKDFIHTDKIPHRTDIKVEKPSKPIKDRLFAEQKGICNGCAKEFDAVNFEIDHIIPKSKGGGDYYENFQLLCGNCNRVKGDRPMEDLVMRLRAREAIMKKISY